MFYCSCICSYSAHLRPPPEAKSGLILPTPKDHYKTYNVESAGRELMAKVLKDFEPQILKIVELVESGAKTENCLCKNRKSLEARPGRRA